MAQLQREAEPPEERANPVEAENDQEQNEHGRKEDSEKSMFFLPTGERTDGVIRKLAMPLANKLIPIARSSLNVLRKKSLVREVVINNPFIPIELQPVEVHAEAGEETGAGFLARGSGIKGDPTAAGKVGFYPTVSVAGANDIVAADVVEFSGEEAVYFAGGNAQGAKHDGHGGSEIFAMSSTRFEEEMSKRVFTRLAGKIQSVGKIVLQVILESDGFVEGIALRLGDLPGEFGDARIERARELEIGCADFVRIVGGSGASDSRVNGWKKRFGFVFQLNKITEGIEDGASGIAKKSAAVDERIVTGGTVEETGANAEQVCGREERVRCDRLEENGEVQIEGRGSFDGILWIDEDPAVAGGKDAFL